MVRFASEVGGVTKRLPVRAVRRQARSQLRLLDGRAELPLRHSWNFTFEHYQWLGMPYCHPLPFTETHQWEVETCYPDVFTQDFEEWCDYVARKECARMADDPKLIGYFYVDFPTWVHCPENNPKGPWFAPKAT